MFVCCCSNCCAFTSFDSLFSCFNEVKSGLYWDVMGVGYSVWLDIGNSYLSSTSVFDYEVIKVLCSYQRVGVDYNLYLQLVNNPYYDIGYCMLGCYHSLDLLLCSTVKFQGTSFNSICDTVVSWLDYIMSRTAPLYNIVVNGRVEA